MKYRSLWILAALGSAFWLGRAGVDAPVGPTPAFAAETVAVHDGAHFVSTEGGTAYLWHFDGNRVELLGKTQSVDGAEGQAAYVWMPGVERRKP